MSYPALMQYLIEELVDENGQTGFHLSIPTINKVWYVPEAPVSSDHASSIAILLDNASQNDQKTKTWDRGRVVFRSLPKIRASKTEAQNPVINFELHGRKVDGLFALVPTRKMRGKMWYLVNKTKRSEGGGTKSVGTDKSQVWAMPLAAFSGDSKKKAHVNGNVGKGKTSPQIFLQDAQTEKPSIISNDKKKPETKKIAIVASVITSRLSERSSEMDQADDSAKNEGMATEIFGTKSKKVPEKFTASRSISNGVTTQSGIRTPIEFDESLNFHRDGNSFNDVANQSSVPPALSVVSVGISLGDNRSVANVEQAIVAQPVSNTEDPNLDHGLGLVTGEPNGVEESTAKSYDTESEFEQNSFESSTYIDPQYSSNQILLDENSAELTRKDFDPSPMRQTAQTEAVTQITTDPKDPNDLDREFSYVDLEAVEEGLTTPVNRFLNEDDFDPELMPQDHHFRIMDPRFSIRDPRLQPAQPNLEAIDGRVLIDIPVTPKDQYEYNIDNGETVVSARKGELEDSANFVVEIENPNSKVVSKIEECELKLGIKPYFASTPFERIEAIKNELKSRFDAMVNAIKDSDRSIDETQELISGVNRSYSAIISQLDNLKISIHKKNNISDTYSEDLEINIDNFVKLESRFLERSLQILNIERETPALSKM